MPFAIWCLTCPKPTIIGQGVRFNAEKKKVGNYHSTPIFSFRMKHNVCGGPIEIRTDPKNTAYIVTEGAKKRDTGEDKQPEDGQITIRTDEERERLQNDAFAALEVKVDDRKQQSTDQSRIEELQMVKERDWDDPYAASKKLRRTFRAGRKLRQSKEKDTEALKDRMSLGMDLLEETESDRRKAGCVEFGVLDAQTAAINTTMSKKEAELEKSRIKIRQELGNNTRAAMDPFLNNPGAPMLVLDSKPVVKRRAKATPVSSSTESAVQQRTPLVDYDSD